MFDAANVDRIFTIEGDLVTINVYGDLYRFDIRAETVSAYCLITNEWFPLESEWVEEQWLANGMFPEVVKKVTPDHTFKLIGCEGDIFFEIEYYDRTRYIKIW